MMVDDILVGSLLLMILTLIIMIFFLIIKGIVYIVYNISLFLKLLYNNIIAIMFKW